MKPDNVLLAADDRLAAEDVRLTDFSIARLAQESTVQSTGLLGTPGYMPPELFTEGRFSAASDLYATGILLYELLAGRTPFAGSGTAHTVGFRHVQVAPPALPVPAELWQVLSTMLAKDPRVRLSVGATAEALRSLPDRVLDSPALPVQPVPDDWEAAMHTAVVPRAIKMDVLDAAVDVGATNLHDEARAAAAVSADVGPVQALSPRTDELDGATIVGAPRHPAPLGPPPPPPPPPVVPPTDARHADRGRRRTTTAWVAGAAAALLAVVAVVVAVVVAGGGDDEPDPAPPTAAPPPVQVPAGTVPEAESRDAPFPTGLVTTREATWDPETTTAQVTFGFDGTSDTTGPFLVVLPRRTGEDCPLAAFDQAADVTQALASTIGGVPCGWQVPGAAGGLEVTATIPVELTGGDATAALQDWLDSIGTATADALTAIRSGSDFAAQRLTGIRLDVERADRLEVRDQVRYAVFPVWLSQPQVTEPIYVTDLSDGSSPVIAQVAGGPQGFRMTAPCRALIGSGFRFQAVEPGTCQLTATLGELSDDQLVEVRANS